jgi:hypothetical protein
MSAAKLSQRVPTNLDSHVYNPTEANIHALNNPSSGVGARAEISPSES